jgi:hypothetical protein
MMVSAPTHVPGNSTRNLWISDCLAGSFFVAILIRHLRYCTQIFDVEFSDETIYLAAGAFNNIIWPKHEHSGLYSFYYRALSFFLDDPIDLYLMGGLILLIACATAIFVSLRLLSRSPIFALLGTGLFLFSGALATWPRVSHLAIVVLACGLTAIVSVRGLFAKMAVLLLVAFLVAFIRPEFVLVFDLVAVGCVGLGSIAAARAVKARTFAASGGTSAAIGWLCILAVGVLAYAWEFPVLRTDERAFIAFGQHFAVRHVMANQLAINPYVNFVGIVAENFPGAKSVSQALMVAPARYFEFLFGNVIDIFAVSGSFLKRSVSTRVVGVAWGAAGLALILAGLALATRSVVRDRQVQPATGRRRDDYWLNMACVAVLVVPPILACIMIFPRDHYIVVSFYLTLAAIALSVRTFSLSASPPVATAMVGMGLLIATPALPRNAQTNLHDIQALRQIPGIQSLYELDGGWCFYYRPRCITVAPNLMAAEPLSETISKVSAIMMSPGLRTFDQLTRQPIFQELDTAPERLGFEPIRISADRVLLLKRRPLP